MKKKTDFNSPTLPGMGEVKKTTKMLADEYLSGIISNGFIGKNEVYLSNYINADISIALAHVKNTYTTYVLNGKWSLEKYDTVLKEAISRRWFLSNTTFLKLGTLFDEGKLQPKLEVMSSPEPSDDELFDLLMKAQEE